MKKFLLILIFILSNAYLIYPQNYGVSVGVLYGFKTDKLTSGGGLNLSFSYKAYEKIYARAYVSGYYANTDNSQIFPKGGSATFVAIELSALYKPFDKFFQPYGGAGIGYYIPHREGSDHARNIDQNTWLVGEQFDNNGIGANLFAGLYLLKFLFIEAKYAVFASDLTKEYSSTSIGNYTKTSSVTIGIFSINAGLAFQF